MASTYHGHLLHAGVDHESMKLIKPNKSKWNTSGWTSEVMKECTFARERFQTVPPSILRGTKKYNFYGVTALLSHALPCHRPLPASLRVLTDLVNVNKVRNEPKCVLEPPRLSIAWDKRMKHH
jgi:hypothetical protein